MVVIHCAYTEQINPAGATPVLTRDQIWKGLQRKIRHAQDFVPVIKATDVIEEKENEVVREAHFMEFHGNPPRKVREVCRSYPKTKVDFHQPDGSLITNTVSDGPGLTENDYNMTYTFEFRRPDITEGSEQHKKLEREYIESSQMAVHKSIEALRKMGAAGELD